MARVGLDKGKSEASPAYFYNSSATVYCFMSTTQKKQWTN